MKNIAAFFVTVTVAVACVHPRTPVAALPAPEATYASETTTTDAPPAPTVSIEVAPTVVAQIDTAVTPVSAAPIEEIASDTAADEIVAAVPAWDMDVRSYESRERVEHYVKLFSGSARDRIVSRLERGTRYEAMIRGKLRSAGLPEDLTYLALIESGYNPDAYSKAAAVGMWQFMSGTARGSGLRVDWWIDERRDPARSTDAAIRFLKYLNGQFGSLYLAAAAYNGGPGRVSRGLARFADDLEGTTGEDRFFALAEKDYLREETKNDVPQIIAAALVAKEPDRYGLTIKTLPPYVYDSVRVPSATPLAAVATASATTAADLLTLNPHILRGVTPPTGEIYVKIPVGRAASFDSGFAALDSADRVAFSRVVSKKGETLVSVAKRKGLTSTQLGWYNPKVAVLKGGKLRVGQTLLVPTVAVVEAARDVPDPSVERYGSSTKARLHVVKRGESLSTIAKKYKTSVATLKRLNGFRKDTLFPGQAIVVSKAAARPSTTKGKTAKSAKPTSRSRQVKKA